MRDPHIERLIYSVTAGPGISYRANPEPLSFSNSFGKFDVSDGELLFEPAEHFARTDEARAAIEPFLSAWEIQSDLERNVGQIRFKYLKADVIDRSPQPPPGGPRILHAECGNYLVLMGNVTAHLTLARYPEPPSAFRITPEVTMAYRRWLQFREGHEPLQSMAYFVLTLMESIANGRQNAARIFRIDYAVLDHIGRLSSVKGDEATARKIDLTKKLLPLTGSEGAWLEQATRRLIRRLGEHAAGAPLAILAMTDLPALDSWKR